MSHLQAMIDFGVEQMMDKDPVEPGSGMAVLLGWEPGQPTPTELFGMPIPEFEMLVGIYCAFSRRTFGPSRRVGGLIDHLTKELEEIAKDPKDVTEWLDIVFLGLDGATRCMSANMAEAADDGQPLADGETFVPIEEAVAYAVVTAFLKKMTINLRRDWPDWRQFSEDQAIEHDRSGEEPKSDGLFCCHGSCKADPTWEAHWGAGQSHENTQGCDKHIGLLLGDEVGQANLSRLT